MSDKPPVPPHLKGAELSRALQAAITGPDPTRQGVITSPRNVAQSGPGDFRRADHQAQIAAALASGMIAQRTGGTPTTAAEAVAIWREVLQELRGENAPG